MNELRRGERPPFCICPMTIFDPTLVPDLKPLDIAVFVALRSFASGDPRSDRYARAFPGAAALAQRARCSPPHARRALERLRQRGLVYKNLRRRMPAEVVFILDPQLVPVLSRAVQAGDEAGEVRAIAENEAALASLQDSWNSDTAATGDRRRAVNSAGRQERSPVNTQGNHSLESSPANAQGHQERSPAKVEQPKTAHRGTQDRSPVIPDQDQDPDHYEEQQDSGLIGRSVVATASNTNRFPSAGMTRAQLEARKRELQAQTATWRDAKASGAGGGCA